MSEREDLRREVARLRDELKLAKKVATESVSTLERSLQYQSSASRGLEQLLADKVGEVRHVRALLAEKTRELGRQAIVGLLVEAGALRPAASKILETICENLDWDVGIFWTFDAGARELVCLESWTRERFRTMHAEFLSRVRTATFREGSDLPGTAWETLAPVTVFDLAGEKTSPRAELAGAAGIHSACAFPVFVEGRVACVVELMSREWRTLEPKLLGTFDSLGRQIGRFLELQRAKEAMHQGELSIARRVQTSILPRTLKVEGFEIAARMLPAEDVGGDYYDVLPQTAGCWVGIGDVTGHGLAAGIVMVMVQSAIAALVQADPDASPSQVIRILNAMLFENIRERLGADDHVTLSLLRCCSDGRIDMAGAHEEIVVYRHRTGRCERIATPGTWVGAARDIGSVTVDTTHVLEVGDLLVVHTDGLTEATKGREEFGLDRVCAVVEQFHAERPEVVRDRLFDAVLAFSSTPADDITVLVARYHGTTETAPKRSF